MRIAVGLGAVALAVTLPVGSGARACSLMPMTAVGTPMRPFDQARAERGGNRAMTAARLDHARRNLAGGVDPADGLAEMAVPNVRPIYIERSGCGPMNEIDHGAGEETPDDLLAGTRFAGRAEEFPHTWYDFHGETFGTMCNAEFRGRFAAFMRRRLAPDHLQASYLFLAARWHGTAFARHPLQRIAAFEGSARRPPLRWTTEEPWQAQEVRRWMRLVPAGRAFRVATDDFWRESEPALGADDRLCPGAVARWPEAQALIVAAADAELAARRARQPAR